MFSLFLFLASTLAQSSVTDYAPSTNVECPDITNTEFVRVFSPTNQTIHPLEQEYITTRNATVLSQAWLDWLGNGSLLGYDLETFHGLYPTLGIAMPGGGLRAAQYGAATLHALDGRNDTARDAHTGGLLQVATYLSGLSGGSWVTGSMLFNDWPDILDLVFGNGDNLSGWLLELPFATPDGDNIFSDDNQYFFGSILWSVKAKADAGIDTSITDPWARMISYHFLNQTSRKNFFSNDSAHGAGQLWSHIPSIPSFQKHLVPFPLLVTDSRPVGSNSTDVLDLNAVVYEITPYELASYDPNLSAGVNITFAGTHLTNGQPANGSACVNGFDQAGFMMATSASLFNQIFDFARNTIRGFSGSDGKGLLYVLSRQLQEVRTRADDVANWPNPFNGLKKDTFVDSDATWIELLDGASNLENTPYGPHFVKARGVDVVVALQCSADDKNNWPNGTSETFTALRLSDQLVSSHQQFPPIPQSFDAWVSTGVNARPTFFGCDPTQNPPEYMLVIYIPQAPPFNGDNPVMNTDTFRLTYTQKFTRIYFDQVFANTISGFVPNTTDADPNFGLCLQCAALDRGRYKASPVIDRSDFCQTCFTQYCYDESNPPSRSEIPHRKLLFVDPDPQGVFSFLSRNKFKLLGGVIGLVAFIAGLVGGLLWWKKKKQKAQYQRVHNLHDDVDGASVRSKYNSYVRPESSYELPEYRGSM